jgi:hypothetical protein
MSLKPDDALDVLRGIWNARGQDSEELAEAFGTGKTCKRMADVGFDGMAESDDDLRAQWRSRLQREGKLRPDGGSIRDLILGSAEPR